MKLFFILLVSLISLITYAQVDTVSTSNNNTGGPLTFSGYLEAYYAYDFNKPQNHQRPGFLYNFNRHNEFTINLAFLKAAYNSGKIRGNLALMAGTYAQYNLATEPELLRHIFEAHAGVKLGKGLWLDAGIFGSHLGLETAVGKDNFTLTRSLAAENSPYYESGVKVTYEAGTKWVFTGLILNGWQNIQEQEGNSNKAIGTQIQFKSTTSITLNSSTFIGNEKPDSVQQRRYFHDFYATFQIGTNLKMATLFDIGAEKRVGTNKFNFWYTPALLLYLNMSKKAALGGRVEFYQDKKGVIISSSSPQGFKTTGYSLNLDYAPASKILVRVEGRILDSQAEIFNRNNRVVTNSTALTSSIAISF